MKIHEYQAAQIFKDFGMPVPQGVIATEVDQARDFAEKAGFPVVLKSQVLVEGAEKREALKLLKTPRSLKKNLKRFAP